MKTATLVAAVVAVLSAAMLFKTLALMAFSVYVTLLIVDLCYAQKGILQMSLLLTDEEKVSFAVAPKTKAGNPAHLDGPPVWEISNPEVAELVVAEDGLSATVVAKGLGTARVTVKADADLDAGEVRELVSFEDVVVVAAEAASLGIVAGVPELK